MSAPPAPNSVYQQILYSAPLEQDWEWEPGLWLPLARFYAGELE